MRGFRRRSGSASGASGAEDAAVDLSVRLGDLELASPVVTASGTYGHGDEVARLGDVSKLGAITAKSLLPEPWAGKPAPRLHMTASGMLNAVGLQGPGIDAWIDDDLPGLRAAGATVIVSLWGRTVEDYALGASMLVRARHDLVAVEVNVSCPNLHRRAEMFAHDPDATAEVIAAVVAADLGLPVFAKLSPNVTDITEIARAAVESGATGLTLVNTVMGLLIDADTRRPVLGGGGGGLSGPAIKPVALRAVHDVSNALPARPDHRHRGCAIRRRRDRDDARGCDRGRRRYRDVPRPARRTASSTRCAAWCARHRVARHRRSDRRHGGTGVNDARDADARDHLALALDVGDLAAALRVAEPLLPWFGIAKVGMELYAESGPVAFEALRDKGFRVFADMKLYDIPNTLRSAGRVFGRHGVEFLNFPAAVGVASLQAGVEGFKDGARDAGTATPIALAVTVLTSDPDTSALGARMLRRPRGGL